MDNELVQYFFVNKDLDMKKGKIAGQVAHAATIYTYRTLSAVVDSASKQRFQQWYTSVQKKIILKAPQSILERLEALGYVAIRDKGYTQIPENSLTVVTLGVLPRDTALVIAPELNDLHLL